MEYSKMALQLEKYYDISYIENLSNKEVLKLHKKHYPSLHANYIITGIDRSGKRFKPIYTNTPQCYNIWRGTVWKQLENGKRKLLYRIYN